MTVCKYKTVVEGIHHVLPGENRRSSGKFADMLFQNRETRFKVVADPVVRLSLAKSKEGFW